VHYLIRILSEGESQQEAHDNALAFADELVTSGDFDYYGEPGQTHQLTSELGRKAVEAALRANRREFDLAIRAARLMLQEFTDEHIYQDEYPAEPRDYYASRWQFSQVGDGTAYLYGDQSVWGEKIRNDRDYQAATADRTDLWVTALDFHN
jgi:hypothetical protein